ncbi:MAG TPA: 4Fe-4S binding protein [bacterium]|nr:4Fe-4S binding protein [bacterium]
MPKPMDKIGWRELGVGCVIVEPGSASEYHTGSWRSRRPIVDCDKCIRCARCWMYCPDAAIYQREDECYVANLDYCKGCGICAEICPVEAISMVEEV